MKDYLYINGKKIELSAETADNLRKEFSKKEDIVLPEGLIVLNYKNKLSLVNPQNKKQIMFYDEDGFNVISGMITFDTVDKFKLIDCKFKDLKVGDIFRWSYDGEFKYENNCENFDLRMVIEIDDYDVIYQYFNINLVEGSNINKNRDSYFQKVVMCDEE